MKHLPEERKFQLDQWFSENSLWIEVYRLPWKSIQDIFEKEFEIFEFNFGETRSKVREIETIGNRSRERRVWNGQSRSEKASLWGDWGMDQWIGRPLDIEVWSLVTASLFPDATMKHKERKQHSPEPMTIRWWVWHAKAAGLKQDYVHYWKCLCDVCPALYHLYFGYHIPPW